MFHTLHVGKSHMLQGLSGVLVPLVCCVFTHLQIESMIIFSTNNLPYSTVRLPHAVYMRKKQAGRGITICIFTVITRTIQLFKHPPFSSKNAKFLYSKHLNIHVRNYYSNTRTPTPCGDGMGIAECLLSFDSPSGIKWGSQMYNRFRQSLQRSKAGFQMSFDNLCGARTGVRECLLAFDRPSYIN